MNNDIIEKENYDIQENKNDISNIVSNDEMKNLMQMLISEFDMQRQEAMDAYYIFKNMVVNSGDFDSSQATKEALTALLKNAQDASNAKMKIFESILKTKLKQQNIEYSNIKQNNVFMNIDRRLLLKEFEKMKSDNCFCEIMNQTQDIEQELENLTKEQTSYENKKEKNMHSNIINNNEEIDFEIESGDF